VVESDRTGARVSLRSPVSLVAGCLGLVAIGVRLVPGYWLWVVWSLGSAAQNSVLVAGVVLIVVGLVARSPLGLSAALLSAASVLVGALGAFAAMIMSLSGLGPAPFSPEFDTWMKPGVYWAWIVPFMFACGLLILDGFRMDFKRL
jgi:hypothetical protein